MYGVSGRQEPRHGIAELAELGGVSRRTVRYYVQEGLLPAPLGVGRGRHYGADHLERLLQVRHLQEQGLTLDEIRRAIDPRGQSVRKARIQGLTPNPVQPAVVRTAWHHLTVAPGVELHIAAGVAMPPASRLRELVLACHRIFTTAADKDEDSDA